MQKKYLSFKKKESMKSPIPIPKLQTKPTRSAKYGSGA
jgi:hypothetical protein